MCINIVLLHYVVVFVAVVVAAAAAAAAAAVLVVAVDDYVVAGDFVQYLISLKPLFCFSTDRRRIHTMQPPKRKLQVQQ